jgi:hypothetical protein
MLRHISNYTVQKEIHLNETNTILKFIKDQKPVSYASNQFLIVNDIRIVTLL